MEPAFRTTSTFTELQTNIDISPEVFAPDIPADVTIVDRIRGFTLPPSKRQIDSKEEMEELLNDEILVDLVNDARTLKRNPPVTVETSSQASVVPTNDANIKGYNFWIIGASNFLLVVVSVALK